MKCIVISCFLWFSMISCPSVDCVEVDEQRFYDMMNHRISSIEECHDILSIHLDDETYYYLNGMTEGLMDAVDMFDECVKQYTLD